VATVKYQFVIG